MPLRKPRLTTTIAGVKLNNLTLKIDEPTVQKEFDDSVVYRLNSFYPYVQPFSWINLVVNLVELL